MPGWIRSVALILEVAALLPFAFIYKARHSQSRLPRVHPVQGMDNQPRFKGQQVNPLFADTRADRPYPPGTVPQGSLDADDATHTGIRDGRWLESFPVPLTETLVRRGQQRFGIYCTPCHGLAGYGDGVVAVRADRLQEGTWVPPISFHDPTVLARPVGHLFNTITNGIRTMPAYGPQVTVADRWAIVAYVRALQLSQHAPVAALTADERAKLTPEVRP